MSTRLKNSTSSSSSNSNSTPIPNKEEEPVMGIDLGTTFSCVSIIRNNKVDIVADAKTGNRVIASVVCFKGKEKLNGYAARIRMFRNG